MIQAAPFLDPRGQPVNHRMQLIGGPHDGETVSIYGDAPSCEGGCYCFANTIEWAWVWVPDDNLHEVKEPWQ